MSDSPSRRRPLVATRPGGAARKKPAPKPASKSKKPKPKSRAARPSNKNLAMRILAWIARMIWIVFSRTAVIAGLILILAVGYQYMMLPSLDQVLDGRARGSVTLLDRDGNDFAWRGDQFGGVVTADSVSRHLKNAVIATEDKRFYRHFGLSPRGIASAIRINLREGRGPLEGHGGSTITQQTAKLLCLGRTFDRTVWESEADYIRDCRRGSLQRKAQEALYALAMEVKYSKDEILSIYLNRAYMGAGAYGAEAAMQRYFSKSAALVTPQEGAMLAGLLTRPSQLAPTSNLERAQSRAATVLRLMREQGYLTEAEEMLARNAPATLSKVARAATGGAFADWVMQTGPEFFTNDTTEDVIITTTFDPLIQAAAEAGIEQVFAEQVREGSTAQAAVVVMSADGAVRAMVGGRDTKAVGGFNRAVQAQRQTGSAFKPFVYATALDLGSVPRDTVHDAPYCLYVTGSGEWCPRNYTNDYSGDVSLTTALKQSINVPAVKVSEQVGRDLVRQVASTFGIESDLADGPALALGASESSLLEMTGAYAGILNGGSAVTPYGLVQLRIQGDDTPLMQTTGGIRERVIQEKAAQQLIWMMEKVVSEGTGRRAGFGGWQIAGKTGTTQAARDAWFIGFTADYVTGVWMGNDDNSPLANVTGGSLPADIWREVMIRVHAGDPPRPLPMSEGPPPEPQVEIVQPTPLPVSNESIINSVLRDIFAPRQNPQPRQQKDRPKRKDVYGSDR